MTVHGKLLWSKDLVLVAAGSGLYRDNSLHGSNLEVQSAALLGGAAAGIASSQVRFKLEA
jgi:hypothetical protein